MIKMQNKMNNFERSQHFLVDGVAKLLEAPSSSDISNPVAAACRTVKAVRSERFPFKTRDDAVAFFDSADENPELLDEVQ
jgi:hypothetical protein